MDHAANVSWYPDHWAWLLCKGRGDSLLRGFLFIMCCLFAIVVITWCSVGPEASELSWWVFGESVPSYVEHTLWAAPPFVYLAFTASFAWWFRAWMKALWTGSFCRIYENHRFFRGVDAEAVLDQTAPTFDCSRSRPVFPTTSFPIQETLINAVGLTSVARRLH